MRNRLMLLAGLAAFACAMPGVADAAKIPAHPDKLKFPARDYAPPTAAEHRVTLSNGVPVYLVPEKSVPLVTVRVLMRLGPDLNPAGKEGLAEGVVHLMTRSGTATRTAKDLEDRVAFLGAQLDSRMGPGGGGFFGGGPPMTDADSRAEINLLSKDVGEGIALLAECLQGPGFEQDRVNLAREQFMQQMKQRNDDSQDIERYQWGYLMWGEGHWSNRHATKASIDAVTRDDMIAFHEKYVGPENFIIAVSGDFDRDAVLPLLEKSFGTWPTKAEPTGQPAAPTAPADPGLYVVDKDVNQGRVTMGVIAPDRYDPDYQAFRVMNAILGGAGFSSRLVNRIRSDEGLAYSVNSTFMGGERYAEPWRIRFQSKVRSVPYAMQLALGEVERIRKEPVTQAELDLAKNLLIESLPAAFQTADAIAGVLAAEELTGRYQKDPNYFAEVASRVRKVTAADVQRVAQRLLDPSKMVVLAVGNAEEMAKGDPKHDASLATVVGSAPKRLPLRDPMTMKPMATP